MLFSQLKRRKKKLSKVNTVKVFVSTAAAAVVDVDTSPLGKWIFK